MVGSKIDCKNRNRTDNNSNRHFPYKKVNFICILNKNSFRRKLMYDVSKQIYKNNFRFHGWIRDNCQQGYKGYANIDIFYFIDILVPFKEYVDLNILV